MRQGATLILLPAILSVAIGLGLAGGEEPDPYEAVYRYLKPIFARLETGERPAGLYSVRKDGTIRLVTSVDARRSRKDSFPEDTRVYLPPRSDRAPTLTPGQRFLCLPEFKKAIAYRDATTGRTLSRTAMALRILTLEGVEQGATGPPMLSFRLEEYGGRVRLENDGDVFSLPHLQPLVEDIHLRRAQARFQGKRVWSRGGASAACVTDSADETGSIGFARRTTFRVRHLVRVTGRTVEMAIGSSPGVIGGAADSAFHTRAPLVAVLDRPRDLEVGGFEWSGGTVFDERTQTVLDVRKRCIGYYTMFADLWDLEREYSLLPVERAHPEWPRRWLRAVQREGLRAGMTAEMVIWTIGWPSEYAVFSELKTWNHWRYDNLPPFNFWVHFRNGRVVDFGPDGRLP